jgi:hypothetical protein
MSGTNSDGDRGTAAQPSNNDAAARPERSDEEKLIDELYFKRDLNEVHLLIDFVSGRPDRSLEHLTLPDPDPAQPTFGRALSVGEILERIAWMRYPPGNDRVINSKNAAFLIVAKDHLTALASPARSLTIAYTEMFIGAEGWLRYLGRLLPRFGAWLYSIWPRRRQTQPAPAAGDSAQRQPPGLRDSRIQLAYTTFPALKPHAKKFKRFHGFLVFFTLFWFLLTALTYWDASLGRSVLQRLDQFWKDYSATFAAHPELRDPQICNYKPGQQTPPTSNSKDPKVIAACHHLSSLDRVREEAREDLTRAFRCSERSSASKALHVWCWSWILAGGVEPPGYYACPRDARCPKPGTNSQTASRSSDTDGTPQTGAAAPTEAAAGSAATAASTTGSAAPTAGAAAGAKPGDDTASADQPRDQVHWQSAEAVLSAFMTYILPMMFGLLGTMIGAFRAIQAKVRDSELAPRDYALTVLGLPLGAVAGVAVGLFFSPSTVPMPGSGATAGVLSLTAAGLGFLGGYGSQTFFRFIDDLIARVFGETTAVRTAPPPVVRAAPLPRDGSAAPQPVAPPPPPPARPPAAPPPAPPPAAAPRA